ncbi:hypothetical protein BBR47_40880 [Brevibacillus brevis NBRC 100599]|uniref:Uncharacterized protein n=1 Tax=Brevibacillus brevis (strain 47 / JCM 6285 / NBRC 100599) TaxID=358681 RepID=C0ZH06_BREBN|nr:hypothetical protein BBR47_40880 [Brevibacillus brevis NBRC 100599]
MPVSDRFDKEGFPFYLSCTGIALGVSWVFL